MNRAAYDGAAAADGCLYRESQTMTAGADAYHQRDPAAMAMELEEADPVRQAAHEKWALRTEIFSGFLEYVFSDGPCPAEVRARLEGFFRSYDPELARRIRGAREWITPAAAAAVLAKHQPKLAAEAQAKQGNGGLYAWNAQMERELDGAGVGEMLAALARFMVADGPDWRRITAVAYALAKALRPALIAGMSLHDLALLCGDKGRATPQKRIKRIFCERVEAAGHDGIHVHFQKSATVAEKYRVAQLGNHNRRKSSKRRNQK